MVIVKVKSTGVSLFVISCNKLWLRLLHKRHSKFSRIRSKHSLLNSLYLNSNKPSKICFSIAFFLKLTPSISTKDLCHKCGFGSIFIWKNKTLSSHSLCHLHLFFNLVNKEAKIVLKYLLQRITNVDFWIWTVKTTTGRTLVHHYK